MAADWFKCKGDVWCDLFKINLNHETLKMTGVFIIWIEDGNSRKVLRVGKGDIEDELTKCKNDIVMQAFMHKGLKVSFTPVIESQCKSIEVYLYRTLSPTVNGSIPSGLPIKINLPWKQY